jgi:hypothetical protein
MPTPKSRTPAGRTRVTSKSAAKKAAKPSAKPAPKPAAKKAAKTSPAPPRRKPTSAPIAADGHPPVPVSKPVHVATPHAVVPVTAKPDKPSNAAKTDKGSKASKAAEAARAGRVRDKFSMPEADYALIDKLKLSAKRSGIKARKGDLLRLGLRALDDLSSTELQDRLLTLRVHDKRSAKQHAA